MAGNVTERTMEKEPPSSHSSLADPPLTACHSNPLKVSVACYPPTLRASGGNILMDTATFTLTFSLLNTISSFTIKGQNRGISQKEIPEL